MSKTHGNRQRVPPWLRPLVDAAMAVVFLAQMVPGKTGNLPHELLGIAFLVLLAAHHALNRGWLRRLGRGRALWAHVTVASDVALLSSLLGTVITGLLMSRSAVPTLSVPTLAHLMRPLHGACAYVSLMALALHVGLHAGALGAYVGFRGTDRTSRVPSSALTVASLVLGAWAFVRLNVAGKLLGQPSFPDAVTPLALQLAYHLMLAAPFVAAGLLVGSHRTSGIDKTKGERHDE